MPLFLHKQKAGFSHDVACLFVGEMEVITGIPEGERFGEAAHRLLQLLYQPRCELKFQFFLRLGAVAQSVATLLGMQAVPRSIPASVTFFREDLVMKIFLWPFFLFC